MNDTEQKTRKQRDANDALLAIINNIDDNMKNVFTGIEYSKAYCKKNNNDIITTENEKKNDYYIIYYKLNETFNLEKSIEEKLDDFLCPFTDEFKTNNIEYIKNINRLKESNNKELTDYKNTLEKISGTNRLTDKSGVLMSIHTKNLNEKLYDDIFNLNKTITIHKNIQYKVTNIQKYIIIQLGRFQKNENLTFIKNNTMYEMKNNIKIYDVNNKLINFKLRGYIFHSGEFNVGHYTYYRINDDGKYSLYNDNEYKIVSQSENQNLGYIYLYERVPSDATDAKRKYLKYKQKYVKLRDKLAYFVK